MWTTAKPQAAITVAETLARSAQLNRLLSAPLPGGLLMPVATPLADQIRRVREGHSRKLAESSERLGVRLNEAARRGDAAIDKMNAKLEGDAAAYEAEVVALEDEVNQMTNGGPTLESSGDGETKS